MLPRTEAVFSPVDFSTDSVRWKLQREKRREIIKRAKQTEETSKIDRRVITERTQWTHIEKQKNTAGCS